MFLQKIERERNSAMLIITDINWFEHVRVDIFGHISLVQLQYPFTLNGFYVQFVCNVHL